MHGRWVDAMARPPAWGRAGCCVRPARQVHHGLVKGKEAWMRIEEFRPYHFLASTFPKVTLSSSSVK